MDIRITLKRLSPKSQEDKLEKYAKNKGIWYGNEQETEQWNFIGSGCEARVYEDEDLSKIRKVVNYQVFSESPEDFMDNRISLYNKLFPETCYELLGFARVYDEFCFVLRQPFIEGTRLEIGEIVEEMQKRGFKQSKLFYYSNAYYILEDLHQGNILKDKRNNFFVIDAVPSVRIMEDNKKTMGKRLNGYYLQRSKDAAKSVKDMAKHPLKFEKKKEQTNFILNSLYS